jgi:hypothetical protein
MRSQINWADGFFGPSFQVVPDPNLTNLTKFFNVVTIHEGGTENNTLAPTDSCPNSNVDAISNIGDDNSAAYSAKYLVDTVKRLQQNVPAGFSLNTSDALAMQSICAFEYQFIGMSSFCDLFTVGTSASQESIALLILLRPTSGPVSRRLKTSNTTMTLAMVVPLGAHPV